MILAALASLTLLVQGAVAAPPAKPAKEKRICRTTVKTGSRLSPKQCKTAAEWAAEAQANTSDTDAQLRAAARMN